MGVCSHNVKLSYSTTSGSTYTQIHGLQEVPDLSVAPNTIDITTLEDSFAHYMKGIKDLGTLEFTFLYDNSEATSNFRVCKGLESNDVVYFQMEFPDALSTGTGDHHGTQFNFSGSVSVGTVGMGVDAAAQFKLAVMLNSDITVTNPA